MYPRNLTWIELKEYIDNDRGPLVIPIGLLEGHGAHLPIDTDAIIASFVADELARRNEWISLPPIIYTIAIPVRPGNVYIEPEVFGAYLLSIIKHFVEFGQRKFILVLGHGGPDIKNTIIRICDGLCKEHKVSIAAFHIAYILNKLNLVDTSKDRHAGMWETSIVMAIDNNLVDNPSIYKETDPRRYGVVGNPLKASPEIGYRYIEAVINYIESFVKSSRFRGCYYDWL